VTGDADDGGGLLKELAAEYRQSLVSAVAQIRALLSDSTCGPEAAGQLREAYRALHSIAGAAKTFGFPEAGEAARAAQLLLDAHRASGTLPNDGERARLDGLLDRLEREAHAAGG
jgi:HPt (histidine-containing phosphotransfer) domain-containing protein